MDRPDPDSRFKLYRLCECDACGGTGKILERDFEYRPNIKAVNEVVPGRLLRCSWCRGEGRVRELVATAADPEAVGTALVTLGREGEWDDCPVGLLDTEGEVGRKWILKPWLPSARNISDAGRTLAKSRHTKGE